MACFHPMPVWRGDEVAANGGRKLVFASKKASYQGSRLVVPCGRCRGCRVDKSREWGTRILHEAKMHRENTFITLTFANEHLPADNSVSKRDVQLFMKRLRKEYTGKPIRFFACGEYGDKNPEGDKAWPFGRAHYHLALLGHRFDDERLRRKNEFGDRACTSEQLQKLWPFGFSETGTLSARSANYIARYVVKKIGGDMAKDHYLRPHPLTGELHQVQPEFATMSTGSKKDGLGGIGKSWFQKFGGDCFPSDFLIVNGRRVPVPKYYEKLFLRQEAARFEEEAMTVHTVKRFRFRYDELNSLNRQGIDFKPKSALAPIKRERRRKQAAPENRANNTAERLKVREELMVERLKRLPRQL